MGMHSYWMCMFVGHLRRSYKREKQGLCLFPVVVQWSETKVVSILTSNLWLNQLSVCFFSALLKHSVRPRGVCSARWKPSPTSYIYTPQGSYCCVSSPTYLRAGSHGDTSFSSESIMAKLPCCFALAGKLYPSSGWIRLGRSSSWQRYIASESGGGSGISYCVVQGKTDVL